MALKIAINGFGRIGRCVARIIDSRDDVELVCVNDTADRSMTKQLLKYDSVHGIFPGTVELLENDYMQIGKAKVKMFSTRDPKALNFADYGVDVVLECTGALLTQKDTQVFIDNGIKKVVMSAPAKDDTPTFVIGVNEDKYAGQAIVSNASCTTNCLGPVAKILDDAFGIDKGLMTTVHAYTNDQNILDVKHSKDLRRARAAAVNMIPTTTGAAKAIGLVLPHLKGRLHGQSVRVPTPNVSMVDLNVVVKKTTTKEEVNALMKLLRNYMKTCLKTAAKNDMKVRVIGDITKLDEDIQKRILELEEATKNNGGLNFQIAINYGSRDEITRAVRTLAEDVKEGTKDADVIYTDVWVSMGEPDEVWEKRIKELSPYKVTKEVMANAKDTAIFLHCLPAFHDLKTKIGAEMGQRFGIEDMEVTDEVFESAQSKVFDEAENRMHTIKAVMVATLGEF